MRRTKIVCTLGPASSDPEILRFLIRAGMNVARLNFSHGDHASHGQTLAYLRRVSAEEGVPVSVLQDLSGPKLRIGAFETGAVILTKGQSFSLTSAPLVGTVDGVSVSIPNIHEILKPGDDVILADGDILMRVESIQDQKVVCVVLSNGELQSKRGICLPGVVLPFPAMSEKDLADLAFGVQAGVDWIAVSFVRDASDLAPAREALKRLNASIPLVAKIEKREAMENLCSILDATDAVMVARGDLGVEMPIEEVPGSQKRIVREANLRGKPVIVATQMLESMVHNSRPTRAEVTDVANAILDGADALMLSAETAVGEYPVQVVAIMDQIARAAEKDFFQTHAGLPEQFLLAEGVPGAISHGCCTAAKDLGAAAILCCSQSGYTARMISRHRPKALVLGITSQEATLRRMALYWGITPLKIPVVNGTDEMIHYAEAAATSAGFVRNGDLVVLTAGIPLATPGTTNMILAKTIGEDL